MRIDVIRYEPNISSLRPFQILFPTDSLIITAANLFHQVIQETERSMKLRPLRIHNGGCFETLNLPHVSSCEMFVFCDVLRETKQKTQRQLALANCRNVRGLGRVHYID